MQYAHVLGLIHAAILIALCWRSASRLTTGTIPRLCAGYLLTWSNLVYTALIVSMFSRLNDVALYFSTSLVLAAAVEALLHIRRISPQPGKADAVKSAPVRFDGTIRMVLAATLVTAALASLLLCWHYVPNNWDSCTYRFSRAFFYLAQGNLLHFAKTFDSRLLYYPLNGALTYVFFAIYQYGARSMYLITGLAWIFAGLGIYSAARGFGASRTGSWVAAWLGMMSPAVLVQAASTNDEVLAAVPMVIALGFGLSWFATARKRYAILTGIGLALGCGTKLHWMFYWPFVVAAVVLAGIEALRRPFFRAELIRRIPAALLAACVAAPLAGAFVVCNYISSGQITDNAFNNGVLNTPFRLSVAGEKIRINTVQLFFNPIPDLVPPVNPEQRRTTYAAFNRFFMNCCFSDLVGDPKLSASGYKFAGLVKPNGFEYNEYSVWLGFLPHLIGIVLLVGLFTCKSSYASLFCLAAFFFWHVTDSAQNRYVDDVSVYYSFPALLCIAGLGRAWDFARSSRRLIGSVMLTCFFAVIATHIILGTNLLAFGALRNLKFVLHRPSPPADVHTVDPVVVAAVQSAHQIYIPFTHWEVLYWNFIRFNPAASYRTGLDLHAPSSDVTMLLSIVRQGQLDLLPAKLPDGTVPGLTYLGLADHEHIFAANSRIESRYSGRNGYTVIPLTWSIDSATGARVRVQTGGAHGPPGRIQSLACCLGIQPADGVELRYVLQSTMTQTQLVHDWFLPGQADDGLSLEPTVKYDTLSVETRSIKHSDEVIRTVHRLDNAAYVVGGNETTYTRNPPLPVSIPTLAPEPYELGGRHYTVSWLGKETPFSVMNLGKEAQVTVELQLATFGKPHTAELLSTGRLVDRPVPISHIFWVNGAEIVRFGVTLGHGENKFVLTSKETPNELPGGRQVCFLLIGDITAVATLPGKSGTH